MDTWDRLPNDGATSQTCAFCGASATEDRALIAGPTNVCICSECILFAYSMLEVSGALPRDTDVDGRPPAWGDDEKTGVHELEAIKRD
jgi:hypothetical protein